MSPIMNNPSRASLALSSSLRDRAGAARPSSSGAGGSLAAAIAYHEASHVVAGRYLGFEIGVATIVPSQHFGGAVRGPGCDLDESPADMIADAMARCDEAMELMPHRGEPRDDCGVWSAHATSRCIELLAGKEGERLSGFDCEGGAATDMALAKIYAGTVCLSSEAVDAFLDYCKIEAHELLKARWHAVQAVARALEERKTLDGAEIDAIIFAAESKATHEDELRRRQRMVDMTARAEEFNRA
jgi:hypothetical protein